MRFYSVLYRKTSETYYVIFRDENEGPDMWYIHSGGFPDKGTATEIMEGLRLLERKRQS